MASPQTEAPNSGRDSIRAIFKQYRRAYLALNIAYYGLVIAAMLFVSTQPELQRSLLEIINVSYNQTLPSVVQAYESGNFPLAAGLTFVINFALGSLVAITLPNLVVPFWGVFMGLVRAMAWGLILAPTQPVLAMAMIPHYLTLILEGQGYILAMLAAYIHWRAVFKPESVGASTRWSAYKIGLTRTGRLYLLVALVLAVAAIYEAFEVIYIVPLLVGQYATSEDRNIRPMI